MSRLDGYRGGQPTVAVGNLFAALDTKKKKSSGGAAVAAVGKKTKVLSHAPAAGLWPAL